MHVHTLIIGSGAAGLNAAVQLRELGLKDVLVVTEGLHKGTSINTGSDKQTYYKISLSGSEADSPRAMAETFFDGGSMHGDLALVEASGSVRAFMNLVRWGVPFPHDRFGQYVGYKTDHDPFRRATSIGPYTSREICLRLIESLERDQVAIRENCRAVELVVVKENDEKRAGGAVLYTRKGDLEVVTAENVIFAAGGPGGLYKTSVYPGVHTGSIGLALLAGAAAQGLPESQFGLASTAFRWNVSGSYMQVIPRFVSTEEDGSDPREFLRESFDSTGEMCSKVFLKGYQWPFDTQKAQTGSSIIDILVYVETVLKKRTVYLDFRSNPEGLHFDSLSSEAGDYLRRCGAFQDTPVERLAHMNPGALSLYRDHGIDLKQDMLEIAVCAQHNNGGLAGDVWWESSTIRRLFPIGEVNGSHGVCRPGGSALNAGQVGAFRAAELIASRYVEKTLDQPKAKALGNALSMRLNMWLDKCAKAEMTWQEERNEFQTRMSRYAAHIRRPEALAAAVKAARAQWTRIQSCGCRYKGKRAASEALQTRQLCYAHYVYLDAVRHAIESGMGSRGSGLVLGEAGERVHPALGNDWTMQPEDAGFREKVLLTLPQGAKLEHKWIPRRPIPKPDDWFEQVWADFKSGQIYEDAGALQTPVGSENE